MFFLRKNGKKISKVTLYKKMIWQKNRCIFIEFVLTLCVHALKLQQIILLYFEYYTKMPKVRRIRKGFKSLKQTQLEKEKHLVTKECEVVEKVSYM